MARQLTEIRPFPRMTVLTRIEKSQEMNTRVGGRHLIANPVVAKNRILCSRLSLGLKS